MDREEKAPPSLCTSSDSEDEDGGKDGSSSRRPGPGEGPGGAQRSSSLSSPNTRKGGKVKVNKIQQEATRLKDEGNELYHDYKYSEAIAKYEASVEANSKNPDSVARADHLAKVKSNLAMSFIKKQDYHRAKEAALCAIDALPSYHRGYQRWSNALFALGMKKAALFAIHKGRVCSNTDGRNELDNELATIKKADSAAYAEVEERLQNVSEKERVRYLKEMDLRKIIPLVEGNKYMDVDESESSDDEGSKPRCFRNQPVKRGHTTLSGSSEDAVPRKQPHQSPLPSGPVSDPTKTEPAKRPTAGEQIRMELEKKVKEAKDVEAKREKEAKDLEARKEKAMRETAARKEKEIRASEPPRGDTLDKSTVQIYQQLVAEGSTSLQNKVPRTCVDKMGQALEILNTKYSSLKWSKGMTYSDNPEVVAVKYVYCRACTETNCYETIVMGRAVLETIPIQHKAVRFPAVFLGFGLLYKKLNRYEVGLEYVNRGLDYLDRGLAVDPCSWPGLPLQPLEETILENLARLLRALQLELRTPPRPDAVCKLADCTSLQQAHHLLPSENIYLSDPDYRGFYRIFCSDNCIMDYHKTCWIHHKETFISVLKLNKLPTERDFFGKGCFTPDCEGRIYKIEVHDQDGTSNAFEDKSYEEERKRREAKSRREPDTRSNSKAKTVDLIKKFKKIKSGVKQLSPEGENGGLCAPDNTASSRADNNKENHASNHQAADQEGPAVDEEAEPIDYSAIDVSNALVIKKNNRGDQQQQQLEEEDNRKKKKGANKKMVISLGEFIGNTGTERNPESWPGHQSFIGSVDTFEGRVARGEAFKAQLEGDVELNPAPRFKQPDCTRFSISSQGCNSSSRSSGTSSPMEGDLEAMRESVLTYIYDLLKNNGPQQVDRPWLSLTPEMDKLIGGRDQVADFLVDDEKGRFGVYKDRYVYIASDLPKAIQMYNAEKSGSQRTTTSACQIIDIDGGGESLGSFARSMKARLLVGSSDTGRAATTLPPQPSAPPPVVGPPTVHCGIQTDVSSLDLEEYNDVMTLHQTNSQLAEELQEARDRLFQIQKDKKIEIKELTDKNNAITEDLKRARTDAVRYRDEVARMGKICKEAAERERELKLAQDKLDTALQEIRRLKHQVDEEQQLSFNLSIKGKQDHDEIQQLRLSAATGVAMQKELSLQAEAQILTRLIELRLEQAARAVRFLMGGLNNEPAATAAAVQRVIGELNEYVARLHAAKDEVHQEAVRKGRRVAEPEFLASLDFDLGRLELPAVGSSELTVLLLSLTAPAVVPRAGPTGFNPAGPPPILRPSSAAGMRLPPPGLPPPMMPQAQFLPHGRPLSADVFGFPGEPPVSSFSSAPSPVRNMPDGAMSRPTISPAASPIPFPDLQQPARPASNSGSSVMRPPPACPTPAPLPPRQQYPRVSPSIPAVQENGRMPAPAAAAAAAAAPRPREDMAAGRSLKKNHEKLLQQLIVKYPVLNETIANRYIQQLRQSNGGKLSGMSLPDIYKQVGTFIARDSVKEDQDNGEDCCICLNSKQEGIVTSLDPCGHMFHKKCVKQWLEQERSGNTCPVCRSFVTRDDEFPSLA